MNLKIINSNSAGNCYILENETEALLIECGVAFPKIKEALQFNLRKVAGCILTHEHGDHAKAAKDLMGVGINVYASEGTHKALGIDKSHRAIVTFKGDEFRVGNFRIKAFDIQHDVAEPLGFLIWHEETGLILFLTDSYYCKYTFPGLNNILIEANYCKTILDRRMAGGESPEQVLNRVIRSHMSLTNCKAMLGANDLSQVNNIVLIHLSDGNSDAVRFKREVEEQTGKVVHVADAGMNLLFNKKPF